MGEFKSICITCSQIHKKGEEEKNPAHLRSIDDESRGKGKAEDLIID